MKLGFLKRLCLLLFAISLTATPGLAENYPNRPVRLIVPYAAGGTTDLIGRTLAQQLSKILGQQIFVENRPGGGSSIGCDVVARAKPDGYTLLLGPADGLAILPAVKKRVPYDPVKSFTPIARFATSPLVYSVSSTLPVHTLKELVSYAKSRPNGVTYGMQGVGSIGQLAIALLTTETDVKMVGVPYSGGGPMLIDLLSNRVQLVASGPTLVASSAAAGKVRMLAQAGVARHPLIPNVPTTAEAGYPKIVVVSWFGLVGPPGLPQPIVARLSEAVKQAADSEIVQKPLINAGAEAAYLSPGDFGRFIAQEGNKWKALVKTAGIPRSD